MSSSGSSNSTAALAPPTQQQQQQQSPGNASRKRRRSNSSSSSKKGKSAGYARKKPRKGTCKPTGARKAFARSKSRGDGQKTLEAHLISAVKRVARSQPDHPMFGELEDGLPRAPYLVRNASGAEHGSAVSWRKICRSIAGTAAADCGIHSLAEAKERCWLTQRNVTSFNKNTDGQVHVFRKVLSVRVVHFLADPTPERWEWLAAADTEQPFDHYCARGCSRSDQTGTCINGLTHGSVSSRADNEDRKKCTYGARALCPGHGPRAVKCIFTHPDSGELQPCRNSDESVGPCSCPRACF